MDVQKIFDPDPSRPIAGAPVRPYPWLLIDGGGLATTAWATHRDLEYAEDRVKATVYVFVTTLASLSRLAAGDARIVVAWDGYDNRRYRRGFHPWYKFGRGSVIKRDEVYVAVDQIESLLRHMGIASLDVPGREADDLVATLAREIDEGLDQQCLIFSDDKDFVQLVGNNVHLCRRSMNGIIMTPEQCELLGALYGLDYLYVKALMGDPGDNIRGLRGIGEVKARRIMDAIPDLMDTAMDDPSLIDWDQLDVTTRRAVARAGRVLLWPPKMADPAFGREFARLHGIHPPVEAELYDEDCLEAAATEAARCLELVELDRFMDHPEVVFPEPNVEAIPAILRRLDLHGETDLLSSIYSLAGMRNRDLTPPRTSAVRAGHAVDDAAPPKDMF